MAGPALPPVVSGAWLAGNLDRVRVVDVRWYLDRSRSGRAAYRGGHIPGAVWLDVDTDLSEPASASGGRHPLASPRRFASALGRAGIAAGTPVVAYDDASGSTAGRLWWMLHALGEPAAVLDGGIDAWPGGLTAEVPSFPAVSRVAVPWPAQRFVGAGEVAATVARTAGTAPRPVFDARAAERFSRGDPEVDPRPGHIPGALSAPWAGNVDESGRFLPAARLRDRFAAAAGTGAIAYCGSGVSACADLLAMTIAGLDDGAGLALYTGSWSQWGADRARPAETGAPSPPV